MTGMLTDWRMTLHDAEDKNYQILKEKLMKERSLKKKEITGEGQDDDQPLSNNVIVVAKKMTLPEDVIVVAKKMTVEDDSLQNDEDKFLTKARNVSLNSVRSNEKVRDAKKNLLKTKMKKTPAKQKLPRSSTVKNSPVAKSMVNMLNSMNLPCVKSMAAKLDQD
jgi:hypothetical protein